jgi:SAM-dependent methyltransferase
MDVVDFKNFYESRLGEVTTNLIQRQLATLAQPKTAQTVMGLGFALPYMRFNDENVLQLSFMLAKKGVIHWPEHAANRSALIDESDLPLLESTIDLAVLVHGLEHAESPLDMLQEVWRVMAPQGRLLLVVPNRRGLWAASEATPFGYGQPFSSGQIAGLLKDAKFTATQWRRALYMPPSQLDIVMKTGRFFDTFGSRLTARFSGVIIVEAMKQVYAFSSGKRVRRLVPGFRPVLLPSPQPFRLETDERGSQAP